MLVSAGSWALSPPVFGTVSALESSGPGHVAGHCFGLSSTAGVKGIAEASLPSFQKMPLTNDHCSFLLGHKDVGFSSPPEKRQVKVPRV